MLIIKADGRKEPFSLGKIIASLERIGVKPAQAKQIAQTAKSRFRDIVSSDEIFHAVIGMLKDLDSALASKYNLRRALMQFGPAGYPFEQYMAHVLEALGYQTMTNQFIKGACVTHEVDIVAKNTTHDYVVECKYHNTPGARSDVKVALYSWARFQDIKQQWETKPEHSYESHNIWLITNTRFTQDAIDYGNCMGMKITGWGYPRDETLEQMIHRTQTYPINIFPGLVNQETFNKLYQAKLYLAKDLLNKPIKDLSRKTKINQGDLTVLVAEAEKLKSDANG